MKEIHKSIFSLNGEAYDRKGELVIAMHPWYGSEIGGSMLESNWFPFTTHDEYIEDMNRLIKSHDGPLILFEEYCNIYHMIKYMKEMGCKKDRYFIITDDDNSDIRQGSFSDAASFIKRFILY